MFRLKKKTTRYAKKGNVQLIDRKTSLIETVLKEAWTLNLLGRDFKAAISNTFKEL